MAAAAGRAAASSPACAAPCHSSLLFSCAPAPPCLPRQRQQHQHQQQQPAASSSRASAATAAAPAQRLVARAAARGRSPSPSAPGSGGSASAGGGGGGPAPSQQPPAVRVRVAAPAAALDAAPAPAAAAPAPFAIMASLEEDGDMLARIMRPVEADMAELAAALRGIAGGRHAMLEAAAQQIFGAGGKRLRPMIVLLVARATAQLVGMSDITPRHRSLAQITEMIHTASLVHDDVLDEAALRRGAATVHARFGTRLAVLAGDFLFAQSSWMLANLDNLEVIKLISQVIADFANGEVAQAGALFDTSATLEAYVEKSYYKTASLIAAAARGSAAFSGCDEGVKAAMHSYGTHLGLAFQVVDDVLDFTTPAEVLGKPQGQDLASGNLTAPAIFALRASPELAGIIDSEFADGQPALARALELVDEAGGLEAARALALEEAGAARDALRCLPEGEAKTSLLLMVDYVLGRLR